ncbi:hypothetical protein [Bacteroides thetaiotaomicron]|uniref:hypothetical protein n=1 Tax=Bacteroides thetaiotaomicron TaxID=818 RepID=UPI0028F41EE2|nr:hypothetical protein [Bacteroides thetaiotaomicron]WOG21320.1 hypothetical protein RJT07_08235 [Bacteroides thetaiotaomicron]
MKELKAVLLCLMVTILNIACSTSDDNNGSNDEKSENEEQKVTTIKTVQELQVAFENASDNPDQPTKIALAADMKFFIDLSNNKTMKYIELDGQGHTWSYTDYKDSFIYANYLSMKLTNIILDAGVSIEQGEDVSLLLIDRVHLTLSKGTTIKGYKFSSIYVQSNCKLVTEKECTVEGSIAVNSQRGKTTESGIIQYKGGDLSKAPLNIPFNGHTNTPAEPIRLADAISTKWSLNANFYGNISFPINGLTIVEGDGIYTMTKADFDKLSVIVYTAFEANEESQINTNYCKLKWDAENNCAVLVKK